MKYKASFILAVISILLICNTSYAEFYRYNIDELARKAKVCLLEIERKIAEEETANELRGVLAELQLLFEKAESLYVEKRYEDAIMVYQKIDGMSRDPKITKWIGK